MAMHQFTFESGGVDPEQFLRDMAPQQVVASLRNVVSMLSIPLPGRNRASAPADVDLILSDELRWLESAVAGASDPKAATEHLAGKLGEGLDIESDPAAGDFLDGARLNMRQAMFFCWTALPPARRTSPEVERIVRFVLSADFALLEDVRQEISGN